MILRLVLSFYFLCFVTGNSWTRKYADSPQELITAEDKIGLCTNDENPPQAIPQQDASGLVSGRKDLNGHIHTEIGQTTEKEAPLERSAFPNDAENATIASDGDKTIPDQDVTLFNQNKASNDQEETRRDLNIIASELHDFKIPNLITQQNIGQSTKEKEDCYSSLNVKRIVKGVLEHTKKHPQYVDLLIKELQLEIEDEPQLSWFKNKRKSDTKSSVLKQFQYNDKCPPELIKLAMQARRVYLQLKEFLPCLEIMFGYSKDMDSKDVYVQETSPDLNILIATLLKQIENYIPPTPQPKPQNIHITIPEVNLHQVHFEKPPVIVQSITEPVPEIIEPEFIIKESIEQLEPQYIETEYIKPQNIELHNVLPQYIETQDVQPHYIVQQDVESQYIEPQFIKPQYIEPLDLRPQDVPSTAFIPLDLKPQDLEPQFLNPDYIEPQTIKPAYIESQYTKPQEVESQTIEPHLIEPEYIKPHYIEPLFINPDYIEEQYLKPQDTEPQLLKPKDYEPQFLKPDYIETDIVEPQFIKPDYVGPQADKPYHTEPQFVEPQFLKPDYIEPQDSQPQNIETEIIEPKFIKPNYLGPQAGEPYNTEPQFVEPQFLKPQYVEPQYIEPHYIDLQDLQIQDPEPEYIEPQYKRPSAIEPQEIEPQFVRPLSTEPQIKPQGPDTSLQKVPLLPEYMPEKSKLKPEYNPHSDSSPQEQPQPFLEPEKPLKPQTGLPFFKDFYVPIPQSDSSPQEKPQPSLKPEKQLKPQTKWNYFKDFYVPIPLSNYPPQEQPQPFLEPEKQPFLEPEKQPFLEPEKQPFLEPEKQLKPQTDWPYFKDFYVPKHETEVSPEILIEPQDTFYAEEQEPNYVEGTKPIYEEPIYYEEPVYVEEPIYYEEPVYVEPNYDHKPVYVEEPTYVKEPQIIYVRPTANYEPRPINDQKPVYIEEPEYIYVEEPTNEYKPIYVEEPTNEHQPKFVDEPEHIYVQEPTNEYKPIPVEDVYVENPTNEPKPIYVEEPENIYIEEPNNDQHIPIYVEEPEHVYVEEPANQQIPIYERPANENRPIYIEEPTIENRPIYDQRPIDEDRPIYDQRPADDNRPLYIEEPVNEQIYIEEPINENRPIYDQGPTDEGRPIYDERPANDNRPINEVPINEQRPIYIGEPTNENKPYIEGPTKNIPIKEYEPQNTYVEPRPTYESIPAYININPHPSEENKPFDIEPTPTFVEKPIYVSEHEVDYNENPISILEPIYIKPTSLYAEEPIPTYNDELGPIHVEPTPSHIQNPQLSYDNQLTPNYVPIYVEPNNSELTFDKPINVKEPQPLLAEPNPANEFFIEVPIYVKPEPTNLPIAIYDENYIHEFTPIYTDDTYVETNNKNNPSNEFNTLQPIYDEELDYVYVEDSEPINLPSLPDEYLLDSPTTSSVGKLILQLIRDNPSDLIESLVKILEQNRSVFKPKLYRLFSALMDALTKGVVDSKRINEIFNFLLESPKNKRWNNKKKQLLWYLLMPNKKGAIDSETTDDILSLIIAPEEDSKSHILMNQILPLLKQIKKGHVVPKSIEILQNILKWERNQVLTPIQIDNLLSLIKPNNKGNISPKHIDIAITLSNWNKIPYLDSDTIETMFSLMRPNDNKQIDGRAIEIMHEIVSPKKSSFLTKKDITLILSFLNTNSGEKNINPKRLDLVLFMLKNFARAPRLTDMLIKVLTDVDVEKSKYVEIILYLHKNRILSLRLLETLISLIRQEKTGFMNENNIKNVLLLLEPYKITHPKIVIDIYNLLRPGTIPNQNANTNRIPENMKVLLYYLLNSERNQIPKLGPLQTQMPLFNQYQPGNKRTLKLNLLTKLLQTLQWDQKKELATESLTHDYGVIELTYMLKHQKPLLYHPVYYVKYKIPIINFLANIKELLTSKPHMNIDPGKLLQELIIEGNVSEISPSLKGLRKEDILDLTFKDGDLIQAKVLDEKGLKLNEQVKLVHDFNTDVTPEEILQQNKMNALNYYNSGNLGGLTNMGSLDSISNYGNSGSLDTLASKFDRSTLRKLSEQLGYSPLFNKKKARGAIGTYTVR